MWLESLPHAYVLVVSGKEYVWLGWRQRRVKTILAELCLRTGWARLSAADGAKGPCAGMTGAGCPGRPPGPRLAPLAAGRRRRVSDPTDLAGYVVFAPQDTPLAAVVRAAGARWTIASGFEAATSRSGPGSV